MSNIPSNPLEPTLATDLLRRASAVLGSELARLRPASIPEAWLPVSALPAGLPSERLPRTVVAPGRAAPANDPIAHLFASAEGEDLRRRGTDLLERLLAALTESKPGASDPYAERVPLVSAPGPVHSGNTVRTSLRVSNGELTPSDVMLYGTGFISDSGYEIPALRMSISPRGVTIPANGEVMFEIQVAVPSQAPPGQYSGLVQATGCKYVKAVIVFEVL